MKLGVGVPRGGFDRILAYTREAEKLGFDLVATADHIFMECEALTTLTALAMETKRIGLGTCVLDLNRRNPADVAHATATLDWVSRGRLFLGVGKGVWNESAYGLPVNRPVSRMWEALEALRRFWTEEEVDHKGEFFTFPKAKVEARTLQKPHPPIWVAAFGPRMFRIAAELGDGMITQNTAPELFREELTKTKELVKKAGRDSSKFAAVYAPNPVAVSKSPEEAFASIEQSARGFLQRHSDPLAYQLGYKTPWKNPQDVPEEVIDRCYVYGTPDDCITKIEQYKKAGATHFIAVYLLPQGLQSLRLFAQKVLPHFSEKRK